jgi:hypothetical protein
MASTISKYDLTKQSFLRESDYFRISSPLFSALMRSCAADDDIVELATATRRGQHAGQLLPCAAQFLLLKYPDAKLSEYFPAMTAVPRPAQEAFPAFREFCLSRRSELAELLSWRTLNTNLVEKTSSLLPAIQYIARRAKEPLTLLEICCSAGLNMLLDKYHYDYGSFGRVGPEDSPVRLSCKVIGRGKPPVDSIPFIAKRVGVDLVRVDPSDPTDRMWMEAVLWPEWTEERKRLRAALALRSTFDLQTIIGDALELLPSLLEELPGSLCILQSYCMHHWSDAAKAELEQLLRKTGRNRDIHMLGMDMLPGEQPATARDRLVKLAAAGIPILQKSFPSRLDYTLYTAGEARPRLLGQGDGFGAWLDWQVFDE